MNCPKCGAKAYVVTTTQGVTTLLGAGVGGYVASTASTPTGAIVGHLICPGLGTVIGGLLGIMVGATSGAITGSTIGRLLDENTIRLYRCEACEYTWRSR